MKSYNRHMQIVSVEISTTEWARFAEVEDYAARGGIRIEDAIMLLVNKGLSHLELT